MEGHANPFSKQTNCICSPPARGTESFLDRRKPPRKCRLKECSPGETRYTLICLGEITPTFEPSRKTLTPPLAGLVRWARPRTSRDAARTTATVGYAGQTRLGARHSRIVAPASSSIPGEVSSRLAAATTSDLSPSWFMALFYTGPPCGRTQSTSPPRLPSRGCRSAASKAKLWEQAGESAKRSRPARTFRARRRQHHRHRYAAAHGRGRCDMPDREAGRSPRPPSPR